VRAKRITFPWDLTVEEIQLALPPSQDEVIRETKATTRPSTSTDEVTTENTSCGTTAALPPDASSDHADSDHFVDILNARATESPYRWTAKRCRAD
jgi:hypothetical protein